MQAVRNDTLRICPTLRFALLLVVALSLAGHSYARTSKVSMEGLADTKKPVSDSIVLQSVDATCRGGDPILIVTGENVTWYADSAKTVLLAKGNTYWSAPLDTTTTFYLTQTINGIESPVQAITIEVVEAFLLSAVTTPASCGKSDGTMTVAGKGGTVRHPLKYRLDNGPYQFSTVFTNLSGRVYKLTIQIDSLCWGTIDIPVGQQPSPVIADIDSIAPHCGNADGALRIGAYGGRGSLSYSLNGVDFQTDNWFESLAGGAYTVTVRDDSLCTTSQSLSLKKTISLQIHSVDVAPITCDKANGQVTISAEGNGNLTYSLTGRTDQTSDVFANLKAGSYQVRVRDESGCSDSLDVELADQPGGPCGNAFYLPTSFTPNHDGLNDGWAAFFPATSLQLEELILYNRWGEVVFQRTPGSIQNGEILWDGTYKGAILNGLVTYQLTIRFDSGQSRVYRGTVAVL